MSSLTPGLIPSRKLSYTRIARTVTGIGVFYGPSFLYPPEYSLFVPDYPFGYGGFDDPYSPYGLEAPSPSGDFSIDDFGDDGSLRLQVDPKNGQVFVDGFYAGVVEDFNGHFHHLDLRPGVHHIEIRASGYQTLAFDVAIRPDHKTTYQGALTR